MPAFGSITINDGKATPVAHIFSPSGLDQTKNLAVLSDKSGASQISWPVLTTSLSLPSSAPAKGSNSGERVSRAKLSIKVPQVETLGTNDAGLTPPPTLAFVDAVFVEFSFSERSTEANRKDVLAYLKNLLANASVDTLVTKLEPMY